jgi:hypothetical protein
VADPSGPDGAPPLHEPLSPARVALLDFEVTLREVRRDMAVRQAPATAEQVAEVHHRWEVAMAYFCENELEPGGWAEAGLIKPRPWELILPELLDPPLVGPPPPAPGPPIEPAAGAKPESMSRTGPAAKKPRHRPPTPIAKATVKQLKWELAQRKARPRDPDFTQDAIAQKLELNSSRIQQAEGLQQAGWDLLRSHPDFPVEDGFVRWPGAEEAARLLASGRTGN